MRYRFISGIVFIFMVSGCASLTRDQVKSVHVYSQLLKEYTVYPGAAINELVDLEYEATLLNSGTFADRLANQQLWSAYESKKSQLAAVADVDLSIKILGEYADALFMLSSKDLRDSIGTSSLRLGTNIDSSIAQYNSSPKTVKKIPAGIGLLVGEGLTFLGTHYTRNEQARKLKLYVKEGNILVPIVTDAIALGMKELIMRNGITNLKEKIRINQTNLLQNIPSEAYKAYYANEYNRGVAALIVRTDKLEVLAGEVIDAVNNIKKAHQQLTDHLTEKKKFMNVLTDTQALFISIRNLSQAYRQIKK